MDGIKKLIKSYVTKINIQDKVIESIREQNCEARHAGDKEMMSVYANERAVADAQRQAYVQIVADLKSLIYVIGE